MKKKWIAGFILILILYFTVPKIVDIVKFDIAQQKVYELIQSYPADNVNLNMTSYTVEYYDGTTEVSFPFDQKMAKEFLEILQAVPKNAYRNEYTIDADWPDRGDGTADAGLHIMFNDEEQTFALFSYECGYVRFVPDRGVWKNISWIIDDASLSAFMENYLKKVEQSCLRELSSKPISADADYEKAMELFVNEVYPDYLKYDAPGSVRIKEYELIVSHIRFINDEKTRILGSIQYAFVPVSWDSPNIWLDNVEYGTGRYEGMLITSRDFALVLRENGWICTGISLSSRTLK